MKNVFVSLTTSMLIVLGACNTLKPAPAQPVPTQTVAVLPATGMQYYFVTNKLLLPTTQAQTQEFALNVDGDAQNTPDNKFGDLLTLLTSAAKNLKLQETLDQAVNAGQVVSLQVVKTNGLLNDSSVSWSVFLGKTTQSAPTFDGSDQLMIDPAAPVNSPIIGSITKGHFKGGPGTAHIQMVLLGQAVQVDLIGVRIESDFSATGCAHGKMGGGVTSDEFRGNLLPAISEGLNQIMKENNTASNTLLPVFDSDKNGMITAQELENNPLLMAAISPDLDLLDSSGKFNPGQDGVKDSYSVGFGFTCVPAVFTASVK